MTITADNHRITANIAFRPVTIPASLDAADATDFLTMTELRNRIYRAIDGDDDQYIAADSLLHYYLPSDYELRFVWLALLDDTPVGRVGVDIPIEAGSRSAFWLIELLPEVWGRGIGTAAYQLVERTASDHDRTVLQAWARHPDAPGERLVPPTGFGSIPRDHAARFFLRHGYSLEQIERYSRLELRGSSDTIERLLAEAQAASADYRVVQWTLPTPPEYADGYAWMKSRMSTDAPSADMEFDEEAWDAARIAVHDARYLAGGQTMQVTAAQHIASGELCGFNELVIGKDRTRTTHQEDTLVLAEHRGHKLGLLLKCAGLLSWRRVAPDSPRVTTYNAEENRPMLDINEAIGFRPAAYEGAWKKVLASGPDGSGA
ncbi:MAG: GNAT family N-acetyltransferase [Micropruina sp.]|uniref:GNAT family N-acetyltransferase n=1 Tax=Micropruina sp. TaxID=2737536 RepID=UPI0039E70CD3